MSPTRVIVSGATGFLGSALARHLLSHGYEVRGLSRDPSAPPAGLDDVEWYRCQLPRMVDDAALRDAEVLVHCAFDTRFRGAAEARSVNVEGSAFLFEACRERGVKKIVFISSLSAHEDAISTYGRSKLEVEAMLDPTRDVAIRPGHIVGEGGIFSRTARSIARLPFIPLFYGGEQLVQTVALEDVCEAIRLTIEKDLTGTLRVAEPEPVRLRDFYGEIARALDRRPRFARLPGGLTLLALQRAEKLGFRLPISSDNLLGLKRLRAFDLTTDIERLGFTPGPMRESLGRIRWKKLARK